MTTDLTRMPGYMPSLIRPLVLLALALAPLACSGSGASAGAGTGASLARDSAGVTIVESTAPRWRPGEELTLSAEPLVAIGEEGAGTDYEFGNLVAATRLSDGRLVVFDRQAAELRAYDGEGRFLARAGGKGGGPGEYRFVLWMRRLPGDSLMLMDVMSQRITVLASDLTVARSVSLAQAAATSPASGEGRTGRVQMMGPGRFRVVGPFTDGTLLARLEGMGAPAGGGIARDSVTYVRLNADATLRDTVGVFIGDEVQVTQGGSGEQRTFVFGAPPFGKTAQLAVAGDAFYFGAGDRYVIQRVGSDGQLQRVLRRAVEPRPVTPGDIDALKRRELALAADEASSSGVDMRRMIEQKWEHTVTPPTWPAYEQLLLDAAGRLWVRELHSLDQPVRHQAWTVFDADGRMLGAVTLPPSLRVVEIGEDWLLGVHRDELDVQQLRLYALQPGRADR